MMRRAEECVRPDDRLRRSCDELEKCVRAIERHKAASPRVAAMCRRNCVLFGSGDLPAGLDATRVLHRIDPAKDADGLHPLNLGRLVLGEAGPLPCTPRGIVELLRRYDVPIAGADVTVIGRGITVGRSLGLLLTRRSENATVTLCHTGTRDLAAHTRQADIVVVAAGQPGL